MDYKKGDIVQTTENASSEYRNTKGIVTKTPKISDEFIFVALVSNNGEKGVWAVHRDELKNKKHKRSY